ncbi:CaiB/BaiF CoA-transferase family protein [Bosea sp. BK604]|uniref:CaiB/BaiF CoA transferase family protein n=1 Tax=Bosea sp. BK604 TaxID=2512180 RepID=UPI00104F2E95|nr:CaiB/BaiF CoA-transferase family protein [Bosea sp. BK604]TCR70654.1 crotonobetainyl-CoA:carnitine CoA-transferase CaiB-like acyl-CoA transferase [Bosea sp. BK604]
MAALTGCRVLDLGIITAGAATSAILADLGAEVLKIESPSYKDPFRRWTGETLPGEHPDLPPFFRMTNRGKQNVGIDLKTAEGRAIFLDLAARSDIVVENFSRGVLHRLGLDFTALKAVNPRIILASISSQGDDGPDANFVSFGSTLEAMAGLAAITGYEGGSPVVSGIELNYPDQVVAIFAAAMIATAWHATKSGTAKGVHLDLSQRELTSFLCGEQFLAPEAARREGNRQGPGLQECFRSRDGHWIAVTIGAAQLATLGLTVDGNPNDAATWFAARDADEIIAEVTAAGAAAARVLDGNGVLAERGRGWSGALAAGRDGDLVKGTVFAEANRKFDPGTPASLLGTHTREVLARLLGYDETKLDRLISAGVIAEPEQQSTPQKKAMAS